MRRYPNFHEVLRLDRVVKARSHGNLTTHQLRNSAGTVFEITTKTHSRYNARQHRACETLFLICGNTYGTRSHKHGSLSPDTLVDLVPYGMLNLPRYSPVWDEPRDNFTRATLVTTIQRGIFIDGATSTRHLFTPPEHLAPFIDVYTTFGSIAYDEVSAMMLKIVAPPLGGRILREGL